MKYETPEVTALMPAIDAIQITPGNNKTGSQVDSKTGAQNDASGAYADWE